MNSFITELKRRNVFKVGVAYAIVAWLLIQVAATVLPTFNAPHWVLQTITFLIFLGFPLAVFFAWAYELTPEGIKATRSVIPAESITRLTGRKLDFIIIGLLVLAVSFLVVDNYVLQGDGNQNTEVSTEDVGEERHEMVDAVQDSETTVLPNSIAVLPFENLSPRQEDAYFAIGLHEEILNQLSKLGNMNVIARTTMRRYANTEKSMDEIARELNVETVMEGSVRYADGRVRVTAQLIDGREDVHIWSETYERDFDDIFAIESDIAMNVANAMVVAFSEAEQAELEEIPTESTEAYALYLATINHERKGTVEGAELCLDTIDRALQIDPEFVRGWYEKAACHSWRVFFFPQRSQEEQTAAKQSALHALKIDPEFAPAYAMLAFNQAIGGAWMEAEENYRKAQTLGLYEMAYGITPFKFAVGHISEAKELSQRFQQIDPMVSQNSGFLMRLYEILGEQEQADEVYDQGIHLYSEWTAGQFDRLVILMGRHHKEKLRAYIPDRAGGLGKNMLPLLDTPEDALAELHRSVNSDTYSDNPNMLLALSSWAAYFGDQNLALKSLSKSSDINGINAINFWMPLFHKVRGLEAFKDDMRGKGLVAYWRKYGWPHLCKPIDKDDFECN